jgi:hypothetical protein
MLITSVLFVFPELDESQIDVDGNIGVVIRVVPSLGGYEVVGYNG